MFSTDVFRLLYTTQRFGIFGRQRGSTEETVKQLATIFVRPETADAAVAGAGAATTDGVN